MNEYKTINQMNKSEKEIANRYIQEQALENIFLNRNDALKVTQNPQEWNETISYLDINDNIYVACCDEDLVSQIVDWQEVDADELFKNIRYLNFRFYTNQDEGATNE